MQRYEKFWKVGRISQGKFASHHRWREFVSHTDTTESRKGPSQMAIDGVALRREIVQNLIQNSTKYKAISDGRIKVTRKLQNADIKRPSQMAGVWGRLKARNCTKFDSKLYKI